MENRRSFDDVKKEAVERILAGLCELALDAMTKLAQETEDRCNKRIRTLEAQLEESKKENEYLKKQRKCDQCQAEPAMKKKQNQNK